MTACPSLKTCRRTLAAWLLLFGLAAGAQSVRISEFLASNSAGLADDDGDREDWIELHNPGAAPADLAGWALTDDATLLTKWRFPATNLPAGGHLVVFASGKDRTSAGARLHTNFRLSNDGEFLALVRPDGETIASQFAPEYPPQTPNTSFGVTAGGTNAFFRPPTPGAANTGGFSATVADTKFSVDRGFFTAPFDLVITCATPDAQIRYTTNGTPPTATTGLAYSGPVRIAGSTVLRATAFKAGFVPGNVDTHSYVFLDDVIRQSPTGTAPPGWPSSWGGNVVDYGMDPDIVNSPKYRDTIKADLQTLPSFSVVMRLEDLFNGTSGIYANPGQDGITWERPCSLELMYPDGKKGFQINAGIRIRGGFSRSTSNPKHAFRFFFRDSYGAGKLSYPLFGPGAAEEFDGFDLRTFQNYSWSFQGDASGTFMRDVFNRDAQLAMGSQGERGDYYHLYVNGQYWGLFNTCERPEASYAANYYGGQKEDYDVIKVEAGPYTINATDGNLSAWTTLYNTLKAGVTNDAVYQRLIGNHPDGTRNPAYPVYVDPVNLADYMLVILYGGNLDAPISNFLGNTSPNNFFGLRSRVAGAQGFQFFVHDAEHTLLDVNSDRTGPYPSGDGSITKSNPQWFWQKLLESPDFRTVAGDRVHRHFFNGGVLTTPRARDLYLARRDQIDRAVVAESARWGDSKRGTPLERDTHWVAAVNNNLNFIAGRSAVLLNQLRADGVYPGVAAPSFNQHGGSINAGFGLLMTAPAGTIHYTLDGSDPRLAGGALNPAATAYSGLRQLGESTVVKARVRSGGAWSALNEAQFTVIQTFTNLLVTELNYHPVDSPDLDGNQFEFVELKNVGGQELDLSGVSLTNGVTFNFPLGTRLGPGRFAVLVKNPQAFASRHPGVAVAGTYSGSLANSGERVSLAHAVGTPIFSVAYGTEPPWPQAADGGGFSLVPVNPNANPAPDIAGAWRASSAPGGSPGADDPAVGITPVIVNEVLTHTDPPLLDAVELHNPGNVAANIGGWWLSDDLATPKKFRIPAGIAIPAGGHRVFSEADFNAVPNSPTSFTFSSHGDEVWLFSADGAGNLTGYSDGFSFPAAENPVSFGRHVNSLGDISHPPQRQNSLGAVNAGPRIGPVVINEIHYEPAPGDVEFVELKNISGTPVALYDPAAATNAWRLGGADFTLPAGLTLPADGLLVLTAGDPASFRARHGIPAAVPVLGPFSGVLQNQGERLVLERPDRPDLLPDGWFVPYLEVDAVRYNDKAPWPTNAAGRGASLERRVASAFGDDPANWRDSFGAPSPGFDNDGNRPPIVDAGPDFAATAATFPAELTPGGSGRDDGLPAGSPLTFLWAQVSGPGPVEFTDATKTNTTVRFPGPGTYVLRLTASDGELSRSDEGTVTITRPATTQRVIAANSPWRHLDDGSDQGTAWRAPAFNDAAWKSGAAQLGYGDGDEATVVGFGPNGSDKYPTTYFRRSFTIASRAAVRGLKYGLMRDDGAVVYLNGVEVGRDNMPEGTFNYRTYASAVVGDAEESQFFERAVDPALLVDGVNVIAVELHQCNATSSDVSFALYLDVDSDPANVAPVVTIAPAGPPQAGVPLALRGSFTDDGLPQPPGVPALAWSQVSGPAAALFSRTNTATTEVTFPAAGTYTLRFSAHDGLLTDSETITITADGGAGGYAVWAAQHFTAAELANPTVSGEGADPDGDLMTNRDEYLAGTDPRDPVSALELTAQAVAAGGTRLRCAGVAGRTYRFQRTDAVGGGWTDVETIGPLAADGVIEALDGASAVEARFYRVVIP